MELRPIVGDVPLAELAREYVELLEEGQADGLGQYKHPTYGVSHHMLYLMQSRFGTKEASDAVDSAFKAYKEKANAKRTAG